MRHLRLAPLWLRFLIIVLLVVGVFFRFVNLDGKVYWHDETYTSLRISGYTTASVRQQIFNNRVISKESFAKFQRPNLEKGIGETIKSLAIEDSQHPPFYYVIARIWVQIFGNSVRAIRSLSAIISLLVFPSVYWLCRELFKVPLSLPFLAIALIAISPIHVIYAQEAREYILWAVTILLCSASLLRAMRLEFSVFNWGIYTATLTLSLYTFLLSGFVAVAHGIYVIATQKYRWTKTVEAYIIASLAAFLVFIPWILVAIANYFKVNVSTTTTNTHDNLIVSWLLQLNRIFFDLNFGGENPFTYLITSLFLILIGYAIYFLCRTTHEKVWLFIVTLIAVPSLPLMIPDLIFGGMRSASQYLMPAYLGIQLAVAYLLANQLYNGILSRRRIWQIITALVISCGVVSCAVYSQAQTWWNQEISSGNPQVARIINSASRPLLISDGKNYGNLFSLSYLVEPKVRFLLVDKNLAKIPKGFSNVFLLNPTRSLRNGLEKKYKSKTNIVYTDKYYSLWKLVNSEILRRNKIPPKRMFVKSPHPKPHFHSSPPPLPYPPLRGEGRGAAFIAGRGFQTPIPDVRKGG